MEKQPTLYTNSRVLENETGNTDTIHMYLRRAHYHAFERSASLFQMHIAKYKVVLTVPKNVGREVLFIGFGMNLLEKVRGIAEKQGYTVKNIDKTHVVIEGLPQLENYDEWRSRVMIGAEFDYNKRLLQKNLPNKFIPVQAQTPSNENSTNEQRKSNEFEFEVQRTSNKNPTDVQRKTNEDPLAAWNAVGQWMFSQRNPAPEVRPRPKIVNPFVEKRKNPPSALELSMMISVRELCSVMFDLTNTIPAKQRPVYGDRLRELTMRLHEELFVTVERAKNGMDKSRVYEWLVRIQGGLIFLKDMCQFKNTSWVHGLEVVNKLKQDLYGVKK